MWLFWSNFVHLTGRRIVRDVYDWRSEKVLQCYEKARFQAATETDTKTKGMFRRDVFLIIEC